MDHFDFIDQCEFLKINQSFQEIVLSIRHPQMFSNNEHYLVSKVCVSYQCDISILKQWVE
jgi:hypothetical protein